MHCNLWHGWNVFDTSTLLGVKTTLCNRCFTAVPKVLQPTDCHMSEPRVSSCVRKAYWFVTSQCLIPELAWATTMTETTKSQCNKRQLMTNIFSQKLSTKLLNLTAAATHLTRWRWMTSWCRVPATVRRAFTAQSDMHQTEYCTVIHRGPSCTVWHKMDW